MKKSVLAIMMIGLLLATIFCSLTAYAAQQQKGIEKSDICAMVVSVSNEKGRSLLGCLVTASNGQTVYILEYGQIGWGLAYRKNIPKGEYTVTVRRIGYKTARVDVYHSSSAIIYIILEKKFVIQGVTNPALPTNI